jgi:hypothetical protein
LEFHDPRYGVAEDEKLFSPLASPAYSSKPVTTNKNGSLESRRDLHQ